MTGDARIVVEMRNDVVGHFESLVAISGFCAPHHSDAAAGCLVLGTN